MKNFCKKSIIILLFFGCIYVSGQTTKRVLFLGNSYTYFNNLPQLVADMAASTGKTLAFDMNAPGGYYIAQHLTNPTSLAKIEAGNWDHVVLQDQSMALAYPSTYMNMLPYSVRIDSVIKAHNLCAQTMFYSTWGRKNGDSYVCTPPECATTTVINRTYDQMDSTIGAHYKVFADSIKAPVTPVGATWRYIRQNFPLIELFEPDESHPSLAGSFTAACCFYTTIFRSDPTLITHNPGIPAADASNIKNAVKLIVYDHLPDWNVGKYDSLLDNSCLSTGIENPEDIQIHIFPNPVTDMVCIQFSTGQVKEKISIYNVQGVLMKEMILTQTNTYISFAEFPAGLYMIQSMHSPHGIKVLKE